MPGREFIKEVPVYITKGIVNSDLSVLVTPLARSTARVFNSRLEHYLIQNDSTLQIELKDALKTIRILNTEKWKTETKQTVKVMENKPFAKFTIKWFIGSVILIVIFLTIWFFKYKNKILGIIK